MTYNPWYTATYETILASAQLDNITADIERKMLSGGSTNECYPIGLA